MKILFKQNLVAVLVSVLLATAVTGCGSGKTLEQAAASGDLRQVKSLIRKGGNVNYVDLNTQMGNTALIAASQGGYEDVVKYLIEQGADLNKTSFAGATALRKAAFSGHADIVKMLLAAGADPEADTDYYGRSPFVWTILGAKAGGGSRNFVEILRSLKDSGSKCRKSYIHPTKDLPVELKQLAVEAGSDVADALYFACHTET